MSIPKDLPFLACLAMSAIVLQGCGETTCYVGPEPAASQLAATIVHTDTLAAVSGKSAQRKIVLTTTWTIAPEEFSRYPYIVQARSTSVIQAGSTSILFKATLTTASGTRNDTLTTDLSLIRVQTFAALGGTSFLETASVTAKETP